MDIEIVEILVSMDLLEQIHIRLIAVKALAACRHHMIRVERFDESGRSAHPVGERRLGHTVTCKRPWFVSDLP